MAAHYLSRLSDPQRIDPDVEVEGPNGVLRSLGELTDERISVFAFWSRSDHHAVLQRDSLAKIARVIDGYDGTLVTLVEEGRTPDWQHYAEEEDFPFPIYHDIAGATRRSLNVWYVTYFVVDAAGEVQFAYSQIEDVLRQVAALHHRAQQVPTPVVTEEAGRPQ